MTNLTEKLKKGELPEGVYYVLYYGDDTAEVDIYRRVYSLYDDSEVKFTIPQVTEVLAPVPSYDEYQKLLSDQLAKNEGEEINAELEHRLAMVKANGKYPDRISRLKSRVVALSEENTKLKKLLKLNNVLNKGSKSIYAWLKEDTTGEQKKLCADLFDKTEEMIAKINQVLGEE